METLIELYDERPLENVLGPEVFRPRRVVYICPDAAYSDKRTRPKLAAFYAHRGFTPELVYVKAKVFDAAPSTSPAAPTPCFSPPAC